MSAEREQVEALATSISGCLSNVSHLPEWMQVPALGRDTRPLLLLAARAVLASDWLATHDAQVRAEATAAVAALHGPKRMYPEFRFRPWCEECSQGFTAGGDDPPSQRRVYWPCATAKALGLVDPLDPDAPALTPDAGAALRAAQAKALREEAEHIRVSGGEAWGEDESWFTTGRKVANLVAAWINESADDLEAGGES